MWYYICALNSTRLIFISFLWPSPGYMTTQISGTLVRVKKVTKMTMRPVKIIERAKLWKVQKGDWIIYQITMILPTLLTSQQN